MVAVLCVGVMIAWKLPMFCCERLRAVRYLPVAGLCYYGAGISLAAVRFSLAWWEVFLLAGLALLGGNWLLPDPISFFVSPGRRRAVARAIEFIEASDGPRALYGMVEVVGVEPGRHIVAVTIYIPCIPPGRRFVAVGADGGVEELGFEYVAAVHGVRHRL
jgi:hypothetical protein